MFSRKFEIHKLKQILVSPTSYNFSKISFMTSEYFKDILLLKKPGYAGQQVKRPSGEPKIQLSSSFALEIIMVQKLVSDHGLL
jgi:hypothetical protein